MDDFGETTTEAIQRHITNKVLDDFLRHVFKHGNLSQEEKLGLVKRRLEFMGDIIVKPPEVLVPQNIA